MLELCYTRKIHFGNGHVISRDRSWFAFQHCSQSLTTTRRRICTFLSRSFPLSIQTGINGTQPQQHEQMGSFGGANAFGAFGSGAGSLALLIMDWRSGKLAGPRDPPFNPTSVHEHVFEEGEGDEESTYEHVPPVTQRNSAYDDSNVANAPYSDTAGAGRFRDNDDVPPPAGNPTAYSSSPHTGIQAGRRGGDGKGNMASVASSFSFKNTTIDETTSGLPAVPNASGALLNTQNTATTGSGFSDSMFSTLNSQPTGATSPSSPSSISISPGLKPQTTGFSGLKAFKPSSSFGASLLESLPPITMPNSNSTGTAGGASPAAAAVSSPGGMTSFGAVASGLSSQPTRMNSQPTGAPSFGGFGGGSTLGVGLRPQMTGAANPFRASMFTGSMGGPMSATTGAFSSSTSSPSAFTGAAGNFNAGLSASNGTPFGAFGSGLNPNIANHPPVSGHLHPSLPYGQIYRHHYPLLGSASVSLVAVTWIPRARWTRR
jgi:hypothetical protein